MRAILDNFYDFFYSKIFKFYFLFSKKHKYLKIHIYTFYDLLFNLLKDQRQTEKELKNNLYEIYTKFIDIAVYYGDKNLRFLRFLFLSILSVNLKENIKENFAFSDQILIQKSIEKFIIDLFYLSKKDDWIEFSDFEELLKQLKKETKNALYKDLKKSKLISKSEIKRNFKQHEINTIKEFI